MGELEPPWICAHLTEVYQAWVPHAEGQFHSEVSCLCYCSSLIEIVNPSGPSCLCIQYLHMSDQSGEESKGQMILYRVTFGMENL